MDVMVSSSRTQVLSVLQEYHTHLHLQVFTILFWLTCPVYPNQVSLPSSVPFHLAGRIWVHLILSFSSQVHSDSTLPSFPYVRVTRLDPTLASADVGGKGTGNCWSMTLFLNMQHALIPGAFQSEILEDGPGP